MPELLDTLMEIDAYVRDITQYYHQMDAAEWGSKEWQGRLFDLASTLREFNRLIQDLNDSRGLANRTVKSEFTVAR